MLQAEGDEDVSAGAAFFSSSASPAPRQPVEVPRLSPNIRTNDAQRGLLSTPRLTYHSSKMVVLRSGRSTPSAPRGSGAILFSSSRSGTVSERASMPQLRSVRRTPSHGGSTDRAPNETSVFSSRASVTFSSAARGAAAVASLNSTLERIARDAPLAPGLPTAFAHLDTPLSPLRTADCSVDTSSHLRHAAGESWAEVLPPRWPEGDSGSVARRDGPPASCLDSTRAVPITENNAETFLSGDGNRPPGLIAPVSPDPSTYSCETIPQRHADAPSAHLFTPPTPSLSELSALEQERHGYATMDLFSARSESPLQGSSATAQLDATLSSEKALLSPAVVPSLQPCDSFPETRFSERSTDVTERALTWETQTHVAEPSRRSCDVLTSAKPSGLSHARSPSRRLEASARQSGESSEPNQAEKKEALQTNAIASENTQLGRDSSREQQRSRSHWVAKWLMVVILLAVLFHLAVEFWSLEEHQRSFLRRGVEWLQQYMESFSSRWRYIAPQ